MENPWNIKSVYELQYFNCPSCVFKDNSKQIFINHACEKHPEAIEHLKNIQDKSLADTVLPWSQVSVQIIKTEPICETEIFQEDIKESIKDPLNIALEDSFKNENCFENISKNISENIDIAENVEDILSKTYKCKQNKSFDRKYTCPICKEIVRSLAKHNKTVHEGKKNHKCVKCDKDFYFQYQLKIHLSEVHGGTKDHMCGVCGKAFSVARYLGMHIRNVHEGIKYSCKVCDKSFNSNQSLKNHVKTVHDKVRVKCEICNKTVSNTAGLKSHIEFLHGKLLRNGEEDKCQFCEKTFEYSNHLKYHIKDYHQCIRCLTNFKDLKNHYETQHKIQF